ncbi:hypothetical protein [Rhodococcus sp. OK302]|uniref:hypothetical protein n=1 Tax=Rhodococcus sp. OK302 TaxID=1882769 RepID=UPI000B9F6A78|nr:hypothetical protein [Rhodococcus sp. OK302]OYD60816.1 hypothetical protein BDB13_5706 [Rhodococcus sp. OK302]
MLVHPRVGGIVDFTASRLVQAWTGRTSSPIDVFDRSVDQFTSPGCAAIAEESAPETDSGVRADRSALTASAEQQFRTLTQLLDSARRHSQAPRKDTADLCSPEDRSIPSTCSPPPASPANQPALHAHLVGILTRTQKETTKEMSR